MMEENVAQYTSRYLAPRSSDIAFVISEMKHLK